MPKNKTSKPKSGRPSKYNNTFNIEYKDDGYIATNEFSIELLQLIAEMANYKILTITGPPPGEKKEKNINYANRQLKKKYLKNRKEIEKKQHKLRNQLDIKEDKVFFLRNLDDNPKKYRILNGKLIVCNDESSNNNNVLKYGFANSIQRVCNELNKETQNFLTLLIKIFIGSDKSLDQFQEQFFSYFQSSSDQEFKEIKQWNDLFEISFDEKLSLMQSQIDFFKDKYQLNSDQEISAKKVEQKRIEVLKNQQLSLDQFKNIKRPNRPLQLLTRRIFCLFHQYWNVEDFSQ